VSVNAIAWASVVIAGIVGGIYLVMHDHPWLGVLLFLVCSMAELSEKESSKRNAQPGPNDDK
jgi:hypothetical protein